MINRPRYLEALEELLRLMPVTTLLGPRQCGKTTIARMLCEKHGGTYLDLERRSDRVRLSNPEAFLGSLNGLVVIDEVQKSPSLMEVLRPLADRGERPATFLLLGSASPTLLKGTSETLAGRTGFVDLHGFDVEEVGPEHLENLWFRGGFPRSFLADDDRTSGMWLEAFARMLIERDLPALGDFQSASLMRRLWMMLASLQGQVLNCSQLGTSLSVSYKTVQRYLDLLEGAFMIRRLPPWYENSGKRLVKSPKLYIRDSGILHNFLQIDSLYQLKGHIVSGASWEGFALEQFFRFHGSRNCYFWGTHQGAEIDLVCIRNGLRFGIEVKLSEAPDVTRSMRIAKKELGLKHLWVLYPGKNFFPLDEDVTAWPVEAIRSMPLSVCSPSVSLLACK